MNEISKHIGDKIKELRDSKKMTQQELGDLLSYSPMAISHFENGAREIKNSDLQKLADFFKVSFSYFFPSDTALFRADGASNPVAEKSFQDFNSYLDKLDEQ